jgi:hypothetical protein
LLDDIDSYPVTADREEPDGEGNPPVQVPRCDHCEFCRGREGEVRLMVDPAQGGSLDQCSGLE